MAQKPNRKPVSPPMATLPKAVKQPSVGIQKEKNSEVSLKILCLALAVLAFLLYANTLWNGYVLDDVMVLKENTIVLKGTAGVGELLSTPHMRGYMIIPNDLYRPLSLVMFAIEYQIFGLSPMAGHFFNVLTFAACVVLLFLFLVRFFDGKRNAVAFIAALVFAVHPIHTEVVANIKSRDELLCFLFAFWALIEFWEYMDKGKMLRLITGTALLFLAYISKETVITFLAIIPVLFFFNFNKNRTRTFMIMGGTAIATAVFLIIRSSVLNAYNANLPASVEFIDNALSKAPDAVTLITTEIVVLGKYLKLLFIPYPLLATYSFNAIPYSSLTDLRFWVSLSAYGFIIYVMITRFIKDRKDPWAFSILFYLATISLFSNLPFLMGAELAERFEFFASVGICLAAGLAIEKWMLKDGSYSILALKNTKVLAVMVPLLLLFSALTIARNADWKSDFILFTTDVEKSPNDSRLQHYAATSIAESVYATETDTAKRNEWDKLSIGYLRRSLEIYPDYSEAHVELGRIFDRKRMYDSAEVHVKKALSYAPENATAINNLGSVYLSTGKYREAVACFKKSIENNPNFKYAYFNIARTYVQLKQYDSAVINFRKMLSFDPNYLEAQQEIGSAFYQMNNLDSAEVHFRNVIALMPNNANAVNNLGAVFLNAKNYTKAIEEFKKAIAIDPGYLNAYSNLGRCYFFTGQYAAAIDVFGKEISLDPNNGRDVPYMAMSYQKMGNMDMALKYEAVAKQFYSDFKLP